MKVRCLLFTALVFALATTATVRADDPATAAVPTSTDPNAPKLVPVEKKDKDGNVIQRYTAYDDPAHAAQNGGRSEVKQGPFTQFYPSGQVQRTVTYDKDVPNGPELWYYPNGKVWQSFTTKQGKIVGVYRTFSTAGVLLKSETYDGDGHLVKSDTGP